MSKRLMEILSEVKNVDTLQEIVEPIQELVNMVNAGEIESYTLSMHKVHNFDANANSFLNVKINTDPIAILGYGEASKGDLIKSPLAKKLTEETKQKLVSINNLLSAVNTYLKDSIPVNKEQRFGSSHSYFYSVARKELKNNWTEEEAQKWPMFPDFLENLIDTDSVATSNIKKKRKP